MAVVTAAQLNKAKKELEQQPGMTATKGYFQLSARYGITERYVRRLFAKYKLDWNLPEKKAGGCSECGAPVFAKSLCTAHYFRQRRGEGIKACAAALLLGSSSAYHEWMEWQVQTVCVHCRETPQSIGVADVSQRDK